MKKAVVLFAEGFEEIEALTPVDVLRRAGIKVVTAAVGANPVKSARNVIITADTELNKLEMSEYDIIILPGGGGGTNVMAASTDVIKSVQEFAKNKKVAAICAAPIVLAKAGVLSGHKFTCYPGCEEGLSQGEYIKESVVVSGNIITSRGPGTALDFSFEIVASLLGRDVADKVATDMIYR